uniref:Uncharacterized protein n=1 Tax=Arundo donax TaxID=35708 RepID=A0A0A9DT30_ARUDO
MEHLHSLLSLLNSTHGDKTKPTALIRFSVVNDLGDLDDAGLLEELGEALAVDVEGQIADVHLGLLGRLDVLADLLLGLGLVRGGLLSLGDLLLLDDRGGLDGVVTQIHAVLRRDDVPLVLGHLLRLGLLGGGCWLGEVDGGG